MEAGASQNNLRPSAAEKDDGREQRSVQMLFFQKYFYYTVGIEIIIVAALGYWFAIRPQLDAVARWQSQARAVDEQAQAALAQSEKTSAALQRLLDAYNSISVTDVAAINALLPESENMETLFSQLNAAAQQNGIFLTAITLNETTALNAPKRSRLEVAEKIPVDAARAAGLQTVELTLKVSGAGYAAFKNFLAALEQNARLLDISAVSYDSKSEVAEITLNAYYFASAPALQ